MRFLDGAKRRIHFFASRLKYSLWTEVSLVPNEQAETLVRAMVDQFATIGGIPLLAVFDRPKTVAKSWSRHGQVTEWNPTFTSAALDLGLGVELSWPHSPEQKGSVEKLVKWAKRYMQREHLLELGHAALEYLTELTHRRPRVGIRDVDRLHALLKEHGEQALRAAFERGLEEHAIGSECIAHYLKTPRTMPAPGPTQTELPL